MVGAELDTIADGQNHPMKSLYEYCRRSEELVRAFWLATLCREAAFRAAVEKEEKSYGKISSAKIGRFALVKI